METNRKSKTNGRLRRFHIDSPILVGVAVARIAAGILILLLLLLLWSALVAAAVLLVLLVGCHVLSAGISVTGLWLSASASSRSTLQG